MFCTTFNEKEKLWYGANLQPLYNPNISLARGLLFSLTKFGSKIAQISDDSGIELSFDEIRSRSIRVAQNLQSRGFKPKQVFGFMARNSHNVTPIIIGSIAIGCPVNTLDPSFGRAELIHMLKVTKPVLMFCDVACYELISKCLAELQIEAKIFTIDGSIGRSEPVENLLTETHQEHLFIPAEVDGPNETAMIICSSGTMGLSKGVCLSHAALLHSMSEFSLSDSRGIFLCFSSLYWISGLGVILMGTLHGLTRIITTETFTPELQLRLIEKYKVTHTMNAPHQLILMIKSEEISKRDISSVQCLCAGGSKVPSHLKSAVKQYLPNGSIVVGYGMSEFVGAITLDYPATNKIDTTGRLMPGIRCKIIDNNGNRCGIGIDDEICAKPIFRVLGYYGNQQATDNLFDEESFILTGDIGHFDEDGDLFIVDRKKNLIKYCNFQVSPSEIDAFLTESLEIQSACVVGIPDLMATDLPAAVVVRADGSNISEKEVFDMVADHFANHYHLRGGVFFVNSLPTTPSGKVLRREVKDLAIKLRKSKSKGL